MKPLPNQPLNAKGDLQNPLKRAALEFVRAHPGCAFRQIDEHVRPLHTGTPENLYYHLTKMAGRDLLHTTGARPHVRYYPGARPAPPPLPGVAPPRQVQVMFGPVYVPPAAPTLRPGALDHKACASRGHAC
jgi:hypothetical protein